MNTYKVNKIHYRLDIVIIPGTWNFWPNDHYIQYITTVDIGYSDILDIVILLSSDITISNKICMGIQRGHLRTSKIITISNISLCPISLYPISTVCLYSKNNRRYIFSTVI